MPGSFWDCYLTTENSLFGWSFPEMSFILRNTIMLRARRSLSFKLRPVFPKGSINENAPPGFTWNSIDSKFFLLPEKFFKAMVELQLACSDQGYSKPGCFSAD